MTKPASNKYNTGVMVAFYQGFRWAKSQPRIIGIVYLMSLLVAFFSLGPLSNIVSDAISTTDYSNGFQEGFSHTLFTEIMREYGSGINVSILFFASMLVPYFLWSVFRSAGIMGVIHESALGSQSRGFWANGMRYFWPFLKLALLMLLLLATLLFISFIIIQTGNLNPLEMVSESGLIIRIYIALFFIMVIGLLLSTFREVMKALIVLSNHNSIVKHSSIALSQTMKFKTINLTLLYAGALLFISFIYFLLKPYIVNYLLIVIILGQVYLIIRMGYQLAKSTSFYALVSQEL